MIRIEHLTKSFPGVVALDDVSFEIARGECHALLGENGAGKSTLGKMIAGLYRPDAGRILIDGIEARFHSVRDASQAGIAIVHQELIFCPNLSVAENLCLHDLPQRGWFVDRQALRSKAEELLAQVGLDLDVDRLVSSLSIAQEQLVQIAAAVGMNAKVIVFDEPTSSLGKSEVERLFQLIRRLREAGTTMVYVSHRLEEIFELCQRVTVLRDGRHIATRPVSEVSHDSLVTLMVGRALGVHQSRGTSTVSSAADAAPRLSIRGLSSPGKFQDFSCTIQPGEIVGLAGLVGAGRTEILQALFGLDSAVTGVVAIDGQPAAHGTPGEARQSGMTLIPEDRKRQGLVLGMNVRENITLPLLDRFRKRRGVVDRRGEQEFVDALRQRLSIRTPSGETPITALSGGNQQKVVFARSQSGNCRILLVDEPTRGVDVGAKQEIHELIEKLAADGAAVLLVSSDLPELLALSGRVLVIRGGQLVAEFAREQATPNAVLRAMAGITPTHELSRVDRPGIVDDPPGQES